MSKFITIKDHYREAHCFKIRLSLLCVSVLVLLTILVARLYNLQISEYRYHATLSEKNRIRIEALPPTRGLIYDAKGRLLAENRPNFSLAVLEGSQSKLKDRLTMLSQVIAITPEEIETFLARAQWSRRPGQFIPLRINLTEAEIARVAVDQYKLPGIRISADLVRYYPYGEFTAHVVGYVGRINEQEEARIDPNAYAGTHYIGKVGLEKYYELALLGQVGYQRVEANARGMVLRVLQEAPPKPGEALRLHLDIDLQKVAYEALEDYSGAIVVLEIPSGGVKALVSKPGYDANLFVQGISVPAFEALQMSSKRPLFNRSVKGQYPPGSTVKPFVALAALETGKIDWQTQIQDPGFYTLKGEKRRYRDWKRGGHGEVNLHRALVESCDTFFYQLADQVGMPPIVSLLSDFGFGVKTGIDLPGESAAVLPDNHWKYQRFEQIWYPGDTLNASIGQGYFLATPMQLAMAIARLAMRGQSLTPTLVQQLPSRSVPRVPRNLTTETAAATVTTNSIRLKDEQDWQRVAAALEDVVHSRRGTARKISTDLKGYKIAGKTGTSQVKGIKQEENYDASKIAQKYWDHALFVGYAPIENPQVAVAVLVENGGGGGAVAAPLARQVMDAYFEYSR